MASLEDQYSVLREYAGTKYCHIEYPNFYLNLTH